MAQTSRFVWHELMTKDVAKAVGFYTRLFGWKAEEMDMGGGMKYTIVKHGDKQVGGIFANPPGAENVPPHWLGYVSVENVDGTVEKAKRMGGAVMKEPMDIPNIGRFAVIHDPQGATIAPFKGTGTPPAQAERAQPGEWAWDELMTTDTGAAKRFYGELFGWGATEHDMGPMGTYVLFKQPGTESDAKAPGMGGAMKLPADAKSPPHWLHYVEHADIDKGAALARELGGQLFVPPTDIPNIGRFAVIADPTGGTFAIYKNAH